MQITLNSSRQNKKDTTVFFTLMDEAETFRWHGDIQQIDMTDAEIQAWLESNVEKLRCEIYCKQYPNVFPIKEEGQTQLQAWQEYAKGTTIDSEWEDTH